MHSGSRRVSGRALIIWHLLLPSASAEDSRTMSEGDSGSYSSLRYLTNVTARIQSSSAFSGPVFVLLMAMMVTLVVVIVLGNALVILAFKVDKSLRRQCNYYFLNLAISDFLVGKWVQVNYQLLSLVTSHANVFDHLFVQFIRTATDCMMFLFCICFSPGNMSKKTPEFYISFSGQYHIILSYFPLNINQILNNVVWRVMCAGLGFYYLNEDIL